MSPNEEKFNQIIDQRNKAKDHEECVLENLKECCVLITPMKMAPSISEPVMPKDRSMEISNVKRNLFFETSVVEVSSRVGNPMNIKPCVAQKKRPVFATHFDDEESSQELVLKLFIEDSPQNKKPIPCQKDAFIDSQQNVDSEMVSPENHNDDCLADSDENLTNSDSFSLSKRDKSTVENCAAETTQLSLKKSFYDSSSKKDKSQRHGPRPKRSLPLRKSSYSDSEKSQDSEPPHSLLQGLLESSDNSNPLLNIAFSDTSYSGMYGQYL